MSDQRDKAGDAGGHEPTLERDCQVGNAIFRAGLPVRYVIQRAERERQYQSRPDVEADRLRRGAAALLRVQHSIGLLPQRKLPQQEGADWFLVVDSDDGSVPFAYPAELGRGFGHDHIKDAMDDDERAGEAKRWRVVPAFAWPDESKAIDLDHLLPLGPSAIELMEPCQNLAFVASGENMTASQLRDRAAELVAHAQRSGLVLTIEQQPLQPLAMGHYRSVVSVREARGAS